MKTIPDTYLNRLTGKGWKVEIDSKDPDIVVLRRGARVETLERSDFERMYKAVA